MTNFLMISSNQTRVVSQVIILLNNDKLEQANIFPNELTEVKKKQLLRLLVSLMSQSKLFLFAVANSRTIISKLKQAVTVNWRLFYKLIVFSLKVHEFQKMKLQNQLVLLFCLILFKLSQPQVADEGIAREDLSETVR